MLSKWISEIGRNIAQYFEVLIAKYQIYYEIGENGITAFGTRNLHVQIIPKKAKQIQNFSFSARSR